MRSGGYGDPTMVGGMADAPTMIHSRPPVDEYRDPYGDDRGGYGGTTYGQPEPPAHGYDGRGRYEPRGGGYGGSTYGQPEPPAHGYDDRGGYDDRAVGYDDRGGYEPRGGQPRRGNPSPDSRRQLDWLDD